MVNECSHVVSFILGFSAILPVSLWNSLGKEPTFEVGVAPQLHEIAHQLATLEHRLEVPGASCPLPQCVQCEPVLRAGLAFEWAPWLHWIIGLGCLLFTWVCCLLGGYLRLKQARSPAVGGVARRRLVPDGQGGFRAITA